jgi:hypothetical protein
MARNLHCILLLLGLASLAGCLGGSSPPTRYYTLRAPTGPEPVALAARYFVTVEPVAVPQSVDRPQIVVREGENRVRLLEFDRWAEPLRAAVARLLADEIGRRLPDAQVAAYGSPMDNSQAVRVLVEVRAFDSMPGAGVRLDALWRVLAGNAQRSGRSLLHEPSAAPGIDSLVRAHSRALAALADELATVVDQLMPKKP